MSDLLFRQKNLEASLRGETPGKFATDLMEGLLLSQYRNSPNLKEYMLAFIEECNTLFAEVDRVYLGRLIEYAEGEQLDIIGIILQESRSLVIPTIFFGFQGATNVDGFGTETDPSLGGVFKSEESLGYEVAPLEDVVYKRLLLVKANCLNSEVISINHAYDCVHILLGRTPTGVFFVVISPRNIELQYSSGGLTSTEVALITAIAKFIIPVGSVFNVRQI